MRDSLFIGWTLTLFVVFVVIWCAIDPEPLERGVILRLCTCLLLFGVAVAVLRVTH